MSEDGFKRVLEDAGWAPVDGPGRPWLDHVHSTAAARLQLRYLDAPTPALDLDVELHDGSATFATFLSLRPGREGPAIVGSLVAAAPTLGRASWPALYDRLVTLADQVVRVDGVDGEDTWEAGPGDHDRVLERVS